MKHVLIATDGSESADEALDFAIEIARDAGATLHVLSVRPPQRSPYDEGRLRAVEEFGGPRRIADTAAARARSAGVEAAADIAHGDVVAGIVDAASTLDVEFVGSRGTPSPRSGAWEASRGLVRNAPAAATRRSSTCRPTASRTSTRRRRCSARSSRTSCSIRRHDA